MSSVIETRVAVALALLAACSCLQGSADSRMQPMGKFIAEEMECKLYLVKADDGSSVGFFVVLRNLSRQKSYFLEGYAPRLSVSAFWDGPPSDGKGFADHNLWLSRHDPKFLMEFAPRQSFWFFLPFAALMRAPLPVEPVKDCTVSAHPDFDVGGSKSKGSDQWEFRRIRFEGGKREGWAQDVVLNRSTIENPAWRYASKMPPAIPND